MSDEAFVADNRKESENSLTTNSMSMESLQSCEYLVDKKALKKRLKKERQKVKKNEGKTKSESVPTDNVNKRMKAPKKETVESDIIVHESDENTQNLSDNDDSNGADISFSDTVPAFIQSIVSQKDIVTKIRKHDSGKGKNSVKDTNYKPDTIFTDDTNGFTSVKKGSKQGSNTFCKTPEGFGNEALRVIRGGKFELGIHYLTRGMALDSTDYRHFINRSYCYMRTGNYKEALDDIRCAMKHLTDITEISRAKCREGQALCGLQEYEAAEESFRESINLAPAFLFAKRELKRMQISQLVDMGFKERDVIMALEKRPTIREAINLLSNVSQTNNSLNDSFDIPTDDDDDDCDEIFLSDTEDNPSNERLLSKLLNYDENTPEEPYVPEPPPNMQAINHYEQYSQMPSQDRVLRVIKAVPTTKPKKAIQGVNDLAVWVGSLTNHVTDAMIHKRFSRFGKVTGIWRPINEAYAFVNFACATATQKALDEATYTGGTIEVNGSKLIIKRATSKSQK